MRGIRGVASPISFAEIVHALLSQMRRLEYTVVDHLSPGLSPETVRERLADAGIHDPPDDLITWFTLINGTLPSINEVEESWFIAQLDILSLDNAIWFLNEVILPVDGEMWLPLFKSDANYYAIDLTPGIPENRIMALYDAQETISLYSHLRAMMETELALLTPENEGEDFIAIGRMYNPDIPYWNE